MRVLQGHFCQDGYFYTADVFSFCVLKHLFVSPKYFWLQSPHAAVYSALAIKKVDRIFPIS